MNAKQTQTRAEKAQHLPVIQVDDEIYYVLSEERKIAYLVTAGKSITCTCADFARNNRSDPEFTCKHILAVLNTDKGTLMHASYLDTCKPKLDDRFIITLKDKDFVLYSGLLDLGHQHGLLKLEVEAVQFPSKDNGMEAICKATAETKTGKVFTDFGDASPQNTNRAIAQHLIRMASTRAKARVLRDMNNIGMTALEELSDLSDVSDNGNGKAAPPRGATGKKRGKVSQLNHDKQQDQAPQSAKQDQAPQSAKQDQAPNTQPDAAELQNNGNRPRISEAQKRAIANLSRRRGISEEELDNHSMEVFGVTIDHLCSSDAASMIRQLQQSA